MGHSIVNNVSGSILFRSDLSSDLSRNPDAPRPVFLSPAGASPRFERTREPRVRDLAESLLVLLRSAPGKFIGGDYFRDCWIAGRVPRGAFAGSLAWHLAFVLLLLPLIELLPARPAAFAPSSQPLTWYGQASELPDLAPPAKISAKRRPKMRRAELPLPESTLEPRPSSEAFHPQLTIVNRPVRLNHPRQTLIEPAAPAEPPKILPPLPNVIAWNSANSPQVPIDTKVLAPRRPRQISAEEIAPPEMTESREELRVIASQPELKMPALAVSSLSAPRAKSARPSESAPNIVEPVDESSRRLIALPAAPAAPRPALAVSSLSAPRAKSARPSESAPNIVEPVDESSRRLIALPAVPAAPRPALAVSSLSAPRAKSARPSGEVSANIAPNLGAVDAAAQNNQRQNNQRLIALSAAPAPVAPPAEPLGNLASKLTISPKGQLGASGGASGNSSASDATRSTLSGSGPSGLSISGSAGSRPAPGRGSAIFVRPGVAAANAPANKKSTMSPPGEFAERLKSGAKPETLLDPTRARTLQVSMPNLTSAIGSWSLSFAELDANEGEPRRFAPQSELSGPVPIHKVDPQYPPELRKEGVEGDIVLYAIIRKDGSVDSVQLLQGVDPVLDASAMKALAQWKFQPAERQGKPVELEAIVHIPLHAVAPLYY